MRERLAALRRLNAVYEMVEEMHSVEVRRAAAAVAEARRVINAEETRTYEARLGGREALLTDDRVGWSLAVVHEEIAGQRKKLLEPILEEREERSEEARTLHLACRLWSDRIRSLVENTSSRISVEEERRAQAIADDHFLARRAWKQRNGQDRDCER
jgi:hypothetical protein